MSTLLPIFCLGFNFIFNFISVTSFSISIFLFNNFILYYFCCYFDNCNVNTHANIQPRGQLSVHMYSLYWLTVQLSHIMFWRTLNCVRSFEDFVRPHPVCSFEDIVRPQQCQHSCQYFQGVLCVHMYCTVTVTVYTVCTGSDLSGALCKWR